jgi:uncharacterized protein
MFKENIMCKLLFSMATLVSINVYANPVVEEILLLTDAKKDYEMSVEEAFHLKDLKTELPSTDDSFYPVAWEHNQRIDRLISRYISWDAVKPKLIRIYQDTYSQDELKYYLEILKSEHGKSILSKSAKLSERSQEELRPVFSEFSGEISKAIKEHSENLKRAIEERKNAK